MDEWRIWFIIVGWGVSIFWSYQIGFSKGVTIGETRERLQWVASKKDKEKKDKEGEQE